MKQAMVLAELHLKEEPKPMRIYDVSQDSFVDGFDDGWYIAVTPHKIDSLPCAKLEGHDLYLIAMRHEVPKEKVNG